jgi:hypothetical protein
MQAAVFRKLLKPLTIESVEFDKPVGAQCARARRPSGAGYTHSPAIPPKPEGFTLHIPCSSSFPAAQRSLPWACCCLVPVLSDSFSPALAHTVDTGRGSPNYG